MSVDSMVLEEELDSGYEATEEEVSEYAMWLGFDLPQEGQLLWIAREGLKAQLPAQWKPCRTAEDEIYYFNFDTGESTWDHPCDDFYRKLYKDEAIKLRNQRKMQQLQISSRAQQTRFSGPVNSVEEESLPGGMTVDESGKDDVYISECKELVPSSTIDRAEEKPTRLVVRWKSALGSGPATDREQKRAQLLEKMKLKVTDGEQQHKANSENETSVVNCEQRIAMQKEHEQEYMKRRHEMLQQVEKWIEVERNLLQEKDTKQLERELCREMEFLQIQEEQRKLVIAAKRIQEEEVDVKKQEELQLRKQKREKEFKAIVEEELDSFEKSRRERLQVHRQELLEREMQVMQLERQEMSCRVSEAMDVHEKILSQKMRTQMLEGAKQTIAAMEKSSFEGEFHNLMERVKRRVEIASEKLRIELNKNTETEMANLRRSLLKKKREEMLQQIQAVDAELNADMAKIEAAIKEACFEIESNYKADNTDHKNRNPDVASTHEETGSSVQTNAALTNALQKVACEVLLGMMVKGKANHREPCCEEKFNEIKHWMADFERKMTTLTLAVEGTRNLCFVGCKACPNRRRRRACACEGNVLMCEAFRPYCPGAGIVDAPGCSDRDTVKIRRRPASACSCNYDRHVEPWKPEAESDSGSSERARSRSRPGKSKREKSTLKCKKKVTHCGASVETPGKHSTGEDQKGGGKREELDVVMNIENEPDGSSLSITSSSTNSSGSNGGAKRRGKLHRLRKGFFVVKGKLLKWSATRRPAAVAASGKSSGRAITDTTAPKIRQGDIAKLQLECRRKLRQLPIGLRWKVAKLVRRSPCDTKTFYTSADDEWPNAETESSADIFNDLPPRLT